MLRAMLRVVAKYGEQCGLVSGGCGDMLCCGKVCLWLCLSATHDHHLQTLSLLAFPVAMCLPA